jgi:O-acetyl-ADP-ribose deacetylase (regulator of RNase III)
MTIEVRTGDLLEAEVDALVNTVNCVGVMGKGIALQFKRRFPDNFRQYERACKAGEVRLGEMFVVPLEELGDRQWIVNFPTKGHWKANSKLSDISAGLDSLIQVIRRLGIRSIAVPPLGAGNGGLHWPDVERLIRSKFAEMPDVSVYLYAPTPGHRAVHPARVRMTWGRAALVRLLEAYAARRRAIEPWEAERGASALEIQKLMYFASLLEPKLKLRFAQGKYGPYSDQVRHLMQEMEGTFTEGFGDGNDRVLALQPVAATAEGSRRAREVASEDLDRELVDPTLRLTSGFEGAYELELLASVHWVVANQGARDAATASELVRGWTERKGRLFTDAHVAAAMSHLRDVGLIETPSTP